MANPLRYFAWVCPRCGSPLTFGAGGARCPRDDAAFPCVAGVWRFLPADRQAALAPFVAHYARVRADEGWGRPDPDYYRRLPFVSPDDPQAAIWRQREASYRAFLDCVLRPLETARVRPLRVLDLGAGNGWLAHRLAERAHTVAAVDIQDHPLDGLGAHIWYGDRGQRARFVPVQAEFDRLPFASDQMDLVLFNAALHYAADAAATLAEALRVLRADGQLVVLDSPVYRGAASGATMVREREERHARRYGQFADALRHEQFLSRARLAALAASLGIRWAIHAPRGRPRRAVELARARLARRREPAALPLLIGERAPLLRPAFPPAVRRLARFGLRWRFRLFQRRRYDRLTVERVAGLDLVVLPRVFNPKLFRSSAFLAERLRAGLVPEGARVLDLGTGSGVGAIIAAERAEYVAAVDINPHAVRCARLNALLHHQEGRIDVRAGDLFAPVRGEHFDLVLFNPPYFRGQPRDPLDHAWRSLDVPERFAAGLAAHLAPGGSALVVLSTNGDAAGFLRACRANDLSVEVIARCDYLSETLALLRLRPRWEGGPPDADRAL